MSWTAIWGHVEVWSCTESYFLIEQFWSLQNSWSKQVSNKKKKKPPRITLCWSIWIQMNMCILHVQLYCIDDVWENKQQFQEADRAYLDPRNWARMLTFASRACFTLVLLLPPCIISFTTFSTFSRVSSSSCSNLACKPNMSMMLSCLWQFDGNDDQRQRSMSVTGAIFPFKQFLCVLYIYVFTSHSL